MAWIESHQELARHPKVRKLAKALGTTIPTAIGHLHLLWWWAVDYAPDGDLSGYDPAEVAVGMMWRGDATELMTAMVESRWIDNHANRVVIHDWPDYGAKRARDRAQSTERQRRYRERQSVTRDITRDTCDSDALTGQDRTRQDKTKSSRARDSIMRMILSGTTSEPALKPAATRRTKLTRRLS